MQEPCVVDTDVKDTSPGSWSVTVTPCAKAGLPDLQCVGQVCALVVPWRAIGKRPGACVLVRPSGGFNLQQWETSRFRYGVSGSPRLPRSVRTNSAAIGTARGRVQR